MTRTILVADDDADNREIMRAALSAAGYQVCLAADGLEAVDLALRERPDLILLDLSMPRLSGWEAARRMKSLPAPARDVPIWAFTAHALAGDELKAREAGCEGYVSKPCVPGEVARRVRERLEGAPCPGS